MGGEITVKQTVRLFLKALVVGLLINGGIYLFSDVTSATQKTTTPQLIQPESLQQPAPNSKAQFSDQNDQ